MNLQDLVQDSDSIENLVSQLTADIYERIKLAIELGKWADGSRLSTEQLENCMQLLILYEARNFAESERTGQQLASCKTEVSASNGSDSVNLQIEQPTTIKIRNEDESSL